MRKSKNTSLMGWVKTSYISNFYVFAPADKNLYKQPVNHIFYIYATVAQPGTAQAWNGEQSKIAGAFWLRQKTACFRKDILEIFAKILQWLGNSNPGRGVYAPVV